MQGTLPFFMLQEKIMNQEENVVARSLRLANRWIHKIMLVIAEVALAAMILIVFFTVVLRYCFSTGIGWAEEVPRLLVNLFSFAAAAIGVRDHLHISVSVFYNLFAKDGLMRKILDILYDVSVLLCGLFMLYFGTQYSWKLAHLTGRLPMTGWNTCIQYIPAAIAGFIITFDSLLFLFGVLKPGDLLYSEEEVDYNEMMRQNKAEAAKKEE